MDNGCKDLWRRDNPDSSEFTGYDRSSGTRSRIDRVYADIKVSSNTNINHIWYPLLIIIMLSVTYLPNHFHHIHLIYQRSSHSFHVPKSNSFTSPFISISSILQIIVQLIHIHHIWFCS